MSKMLCNNLSLMGGLNYRRLICHDFGIIKDNYAYSTSCWQILKNTSWWFIIAPDVNYTCLVFFSQVESRNFDRLKFWYHVIHTSAFEINFVKRNSIPKYCVKYFESCFKLKILFRMLLLFIWQTIPILPMLGKYFDNVGIETIIYI